MIQSFHSHTKSPVFRFKDRVLLPERQMGLAESRYLSPSVLLDYCFSERSVRYRLEESDEVRDMEIEFDATIVQNGDMDAAYVEVPYDIKELTGKGRWLVDALFDDVPYSGQVVRMKTPFYLIGLNKKVRSQLGKTFGDEVHVRLKGRAGTTKQSAQ